MTISTEIGYIMAAMEDAGCDSKKLFSPSAASSSNSTSKPSSKPCPKPTSQKAKAIEEKEEELRYSTDSESILKDSTSISKEYQRPSLRSSLLKKLTRRT